MQCTRRLHSYSNVHLHTGDIDTHSYMHNYISLDIHTSINTRVTPKHKHECTHPACTHPHTLKVYWVFFFPLQKQFFFPSQRIIQFLFFLISLQYIIQFCLLPAWNSFSNGNICFVNQICIMHRMQSTN